MFQKNENAQNGPRSVSGLDGTHVNGRCLHAPFQRESGSAYIVTLLVLFVLTALGLSLALITGSEAQMGSQERTIQRTFFAADSGLDLGVAQTFAGDCSSLCVPVKDESSSLYNANGLEDQIAITKGIGLASSFSTLTQINDSDYRKLTFLVSSSASRVAPDAAGGIPIGQRRVVERFNLDPWDTNNECFTTRLVPCEYDDGNAIETR